LEREHGENLGHHNRAVTAGGRLAGGEHLGDGGGVALGIALFVFVLKAPGIVARVARAPAMRCWRSGFGIGWGSADLGIE
jgi:hypothetical protein